MNTITPTSNAGTATIPAAGSAGADASSTTPEQDDFNNFLLLMTAQLRQQDPLQPLESTEFVAQLATFSSVEQQIKTNDKLDRMLEAVSQGQMQDAVAYIGQQVEVADDSVTVDGDGPHRFGYELSEPVDQAVLRVLDAAERVVREIPLETGAGRRHVEWNGRDNDGRTLPNGEYRVQVDTFENGELAATLGVSQNHRVQEARFDDARGLLLTLANDQVVTPSEISAIVS